MISLKETRLKEVKAVKIGKNMSVNELVSGLGDCAFGAGRLATAVEIYETMLKAETTKFLGISGALVPAGMRNIIAQMIRERYVDVVVTTGANLVHDIIEALGDHHYKIGEVEVGPGADKSVDDVLLREQGMDRIYDMVVPEEAFARLEAFLRGVFEKLDSKSRDKGHTIRELTKAIGENLSDRDSILRSAVDSEVPIFCPAIADSMIGLHAWIYKQTCPLKVDAFDDMKELIEIFCEAPCTGAIILGGGVPKNFIFQTALIAPSREQGQEGFDYAIQITTDTPENGGLSGATLEEAKSWGKIGAKAKAVTVYCDATIALPIIMAAVRARRR
ncbi:MAG: deoxyhypusine synthase [Methanophagales archaeon]|nr:deoxyhypusine synthase [Methanophagales archaeon]MCW3141738.1 deoxyhypusine synthase [Methanophagales archaeon]